MVHVFSRKTSKQNMKKMSGLEINSKNCEMIWREAKTYLLEKGATEIMINNHLKDWKNSELENFEEVVEGIMFSSTNRGLWSKQTDRSEDMIGDFKNSLDSFIPFEIVGKYDHAKGIFEAIDSPQIDYDFDDSSRTKGVTLAKCLFDSSHFLQQFRNFEEFYEFCQKFAKDDRIDVREELPSLLEEKIHGLGFATACDFLKENGYPQYGKPDTHTKYIFSEIGISNSRNDYTIFHDIVRFSRRIGKPPYEVDKLFWLIGSGRFYLSSEEKNKKVKPSKEEFVKRVNGLELSSPNKQLDS